MKLRIYSFVFLCAFLFNSTVFGKDTHLVVVYPFADTSQDDIYLQVVSGIENKFPHIERLELPEGVDNIQPQLDRAHPDRVIALGKRAVDAVSKSSYHTNMIVGLAYFSASEYNGVGLALDSAILTPQLSRLVPFVKRVFVVQDTSYLTIDDPKSSLPSSPQLILKKGSDSISTIRLLGNLLEHEATTTDVVFIPANLPNNILYEVVKVAWDKKIMLLSTNLSHLEGGAMMVFYPDNVGIGEQLALLSNKPNPGYENVKNISVGLNRRIAQHLEIDFPSPTLDLFAVKIK
jgi:hypothetical protein